MYTVSPVWLFVCSLCFLNLNKKASHTTVCKHCLDYVQVELKGIKTCLLSGKTGNHSIFISLICLQVKTADQSRPAAMSSSSIVKSVQSPPEGKRIHGM